MQGTNCQEQKHGDDFNYSLVSRTILLSGENPEQKRQEILDYFLNTFDVYERLFSVLASEDVFFKKVIRLRQPLIFYFAHTASVLY